VGVAPDRDLLGAAEAMPIYEYRCRKCQKRFSVLTLRVSEAAVAECPKCGSRDADRLMSRFATPKSEDARLDALSDPSHLGDLDGEDPKSVSTEKRFWHLRQRYS
jgi:putative FmdB family regulatory protein